MAKLSLMYFSPTHSTKKIVSAVGKVFFEKLLCETTILDLTKLAARSRDYVFEEEDIVVFGAPVYGGRLPQLLVPLLQNCEGNGAKAIVVSVYGNRDYDDALLESCDLFTDRGFVVCAAAAFIGQHSYTSKVGTNRPDAEDLLAAQTFAIAAFNNVMSGSKVRKRLRGNRPYKELSATMRSNKQPPSVDNGRCVHCGNCIAVCPVCNIGKNLETFDRCIGCGACVRFCPAGARSFSDPNIIAAREKLEQNCTVRRWPEFFI